MGRIGAAHWVTVALCFVTFAAACSPRTTTVDYVNTESHVFTVTERTTIERIAEATAREVKAFLPELPDRIRIDVRTGVDVIPETGATASAHSRNRVSWVVDPSRTGGVQATAERELRGTLFHEFHHLVRIATVPSMSLLDRAVGEGMATAFERDFAGMERPWGVYPDDVERWTTEFSALPADAPHGPWMSQHPDGRRWIGYKVGTHLVDRASAASGRSPADLVTAPTSEVVTLALSP